MRMIQILDRRSKGPLNLLLDSTGIQFLGDGEWQARKHGGGEGALRGARSTWPWTRRPPTCAPWSSPRAATATAPSPRSARSNPWGRADPHGDGRWRLRYPPLLHGHPQPAGRSDHADPQERPAVERGWPGGPGLKRDPARQDGRAFSKRWTGYRKRSRVEARMRWLQAFGERTAARDPDPLTAEVHIRIALMNRFSALKHRQNRSCVLTRRKKAEACLQSAFCNNPGLSIEKAEKPDGTKGAQPSDAR